MNDKFSFEADTNYGVYICVATKKSKDSNLYLIGITSPEEFEGEPITFDLEFDPTNQEFVETAWFGALPAQLEEVEQAVIAEFEERNIV